MQAQDATTEFFLKCWPWIEANKNRLIAGAVVVVIVIFVAWYVVCQRQAKETAAGQALTQASLSVGPGLADACLKVATDYPGTVAGQRAQLEGATALFDAGKFSDAQEQFQKYLNVHPDGEFFDQAALGVAASLDAQNRTNLAATAYQRVINNASDAFAVNAAKSGLARIDFAEGRLNDAFVLYQDIANANPGTSLGAEAALRMREIKTKLADAASSALPKVPTAPAASSALPKVPTAPAASSALPKIPTAPAVPAMPAK